MATKKCNKCKREFETDGLQGWVPSSPAGAVSDGTQWDDADCNHCHLCLYDECEVFVYHCRWLCPNCRQQAAQ